MVHILGLLLSIAAHADVASNAAQATTTGRPLVFTGLIQPPQPKKETDDTAQKVMQMLPALMGAMGGAGGGKGKSASDGWTYGNMKPSADPVNVDYDSYEYPKNHVFGYGGYGGGDIGNGLCTAKNANRVQVKAGYCQILKETLENSSCAKNAMQSILSRAGASGSGIGDLTNYCPTYGAMPSGTHILVFQQILAGLITKESGWNSHAAEKPWTKNGKPMGGKGLMQIGVNDRDKDPDCADLNATSIMDPATNIKCGACIALKHLAADGTIGHGTGDTGGSKGIAAYFGPFRDGQSDKRASIAAATRQYCIASTGGGDGARQMAGGASSSAN